MLLRLPRVLLWHMRFFQWLGMFPFPINDSRRNKFSETLARCWPLVVLMLFIALTIQALLRREQFFYTADSFGYFNDMLKLTITLITIITIYMESLWRGDDLHRFWLLYNDLQEDLAEPRRFLKEVYENLRFLAIFYFIQSLEFLVLFMYVYNQHITRHQAMFWSMFYPYMYMVHFRNMQFILHMEVLRKQLEQLKNELAEIVDYTQFATTVEPFRGFSEFIRVKLHEKQQKYLKIYEMLEHLQRAFGLSMVTVLLMFYVKILVDGYFAYMFTSKFVGREYEQCLMLPSLLEIPFFLIVSKNCMNVVKHLTFQLHNIMRKPDDIALSMQIQNFSLQILHSQIKITGIGIITMDGYLLTRIIGSITTYMVFFIQFMPKVRPSFGVERTSSTTGND